MIYDRKKTDMKVNPQLFPFVYWILSLYSLCLCCLFVVYYYKTQRSLFLSCCNTNFWIM